MLYDHRRPDVAVFIDFENVYVSVRDKLDANPNFETIMDRCNDLGRVVIARAYADWYRYPRITSALYANSIEPMYVPTYYYDKDMGRTGRAIKNSVDMNLCIDVMKTLFTNPNIGKFVLVTGDRDFIPLVNSIRQQGKEVIVVGIGGAASTHLAQSADEFIFYEQLVGKDTAFAKSKGQAPSSETATAQSTIAKEGPVHEPDIYGVLVEAIHLVRERGYVSTLGSLKLVMKELMGGDFKESRYKDINGRPFTKFKDFVIDAERRGKVQIYTSGTVNEVFLPGEDPTKLSQFAEDIKEAPVEAELDSSVNVNGYQEHAEAEIENGIPEPASTSRSSRRRRRAKKSAAKRAAEAVKADLNGQPADETDTQAGTFEEIYIPGPMELETLSDAVSFQQAEEVSFDTEPGGSLEDSGAIHADMLADLLAEAGSGESQPDEELFDRILADVVQRDILLNDRVFDEILEGEGAPEDEAIAVPMDALWTEEPAPDTDQASGDEVSTHEEVPWTEEPAPATDQQVFVGDGTETGSERAKEALLEAPAFVDAAAEAMELTVTREAEAETEVDSVQPVVDAPAEAISSEPAPTAEVQEVASSLGYVAEATEPNGGWVQAEAADTPVSAPAVNNLADQVVAEDATTDTADDDASIEHIVFGDDEWQAFRGLMETFSKPVSFQQIFDNLRELRKQQILIRTNEQLRTLVKQAIQNGTLERSGRGSRIYYKLKSNDDD